MNLRLIRVAIASILLTVVGPAIAQSNDSIPATTPPSANRTGAAQVCQADMQTLCAGMTPGDGKLGKCMRANRAKLSSGCAEALKSRIGRRKQS